MSIKDLGLYRTMKLKYVPYFTDGNGRDRYIAFNNGGFFRNKETNKENVRKTGTSFDTKISYKYVSPYMKAPNFHYYSDGNGRDSYICINGGGLFYDSKPLNSYKLSDFLRTDNYGSMYKKTGRSWMTKAHRKYNKLLKSKEKDIINRLYESQKIKFMKKKKNGHPNLSYQQYNEEKYNPLLTDFKGLPKVDKKYYYTLENINDIEKNEETKEKNKTVYNNRKKIMLKKNLIINNEDFVLDSLSRINKFDASNKLKKKNKSFNQAYFHIRNSNYNSKKV